MLKKLLPGRWEKSVYGIDYEKEYRNGIRGVIFDIDNTLVVQDGAADEKAKELIQRLQAIGLKPCVVSNNREERVKTFADTLGIPYLSKAAKPSRKKYRRAMEVLGTGTENTIAIGDQFFTDIFGANRAGISSILVEPLDRKTDTFGVKLKRIPEAFLRLFVKK